MTILYQLVCDGCGYKSLPSKMNLEHDEVSGWHTTWPDGEVTKHYCPKCAKAVKEKELLELNKEKRKLHKKEMKLRGIIT